MTAKVTVKKLRREVGNWVSGDKFWGRENECRALAELLEDHAHVLITAPRRVGKTSLMREVARRLEGRYLCLFIDLEKARAPADAIVELSLATLPHHKLWSRVKEIFRNALESVESLGGTEELLSIKLHAAVHGDWRAKGERLVEGLANSELPVVIFMDELAVMVSRMLGIADGDLTRERIGEVDVFMSFLRAQCLKHRGKMSIVVAGSIGLLPLLRRVGLSGTVTAFTPFELEPWDAHTAIGCIEALARGHGIELGDGVPQRMVRLLGLCVPHHVQVFFNELYLDCRQHDETRASVADVERVFEARMLSSRGHAELSHLEERLKWMLTKDELPLALDLLSEVAVTGAIELATAEAITAEHLPRRGPRQPRQPRLGRQGFERLHAILDVLEHDGYLEKDGERWVFASRLFRSWWKSRFGRAYRAARRQR